MSSNATAAVYLPPTRSLISLKEAAAKCRGCPLWERGTQTVFGEGPQGATLMLVGEQPGEQEDRAGRPFVGAAGRLLDRALEQAAIPRESAYVTNVVKHFKWVPRGKRRLHQNPNAGEVEACKPWLMAELEAVQPVALVCLGATAAKALLGADFRVTKQRGRFVRSTLATYVSATMHPSSILRVRDEGERKQALLALVDDLARVGRVLEQHPQ